MSGSKHALGPYTAEIHGDRNPHYCNGQLVDVAIMAGDKIIARMSGDATEFAGESRIAIPGPSARLFAAAPDLFEACEAFVTAYKKSLQLEKTDVAIALARDAIAKAKGGKQ